MTEPIRVRYSWSTTAKTVMITAAVLIVTPAVAFAGFLIVGGVALATERDPVAYAPITYTLPACDDDAPDPSMTKPCVWEDDNRYWVMDGHGNSQDFYPCVTEDSIVCVWDSATMGNRNADPDAADRFVVNEK